MNAFAKRVRINVRCNVAAARDANRTMLELRRMNAPVAFIENCVRLRKSNMQAAREWAELLK